VAAAPTDINTCPPDIRINIFYRPDIHGQDGATGAPRLEGRAEGVVVDDNHRQDRGRERQRVQADPEHVCGDRAVEPALLQALVHQQVA